VEEERAGALLGKASPGKEGMRFLVMLLLPSKKLASQAASVLEFGRGGEFARDDGFCFSNRRRDAENHLCEKCCRLSQPKPVWQDIKHQD